MTTVVIGAYEDISDATDAINALTEEDDVTPVSVSVAVKDEEGYYADYLEENADTDFQMDTVDDPDAGEGAAIGALAGIVTGLGVTLGAIALPGVGGIIGAGPLVAGLTGGSVGAVAGAATGGIVAGLMDMGIDEENARTYAKTLEEGGVLVAAEVADADVDTAIACMRTGDQVAVEEASDIKWQQTNQ
ncbi:MAG: hypothetical protein GYB64_01465 [Chloroflexi bacterium]|nr:hypothetical protein [Chloroflexota bacterium]